MGRRKQDDQIDWELIEKEYRLGQKSLRQIATEFSVQPSAISRKAKKEFWVQDKSEQVKALSEAQLLVSNTRKATEKATPSNDDIESAATARTNLILGHRVDLGRSRELAISLLGELEGQTASPELLEQLGELLYAPDDNGRDKLNEIYRKIIALPSRVDTMKKLADTLKTLIGAEREAFGIKDEPDVSGKKFMLTVLSDDAMVL